VAARGSGDWRLGGAVVAWAYAADATIKWTPPGAAQVTLWSAQAAHDDDNPLVSTVAERSIITLTSSAFTYTGTGAEYLQGQLETNSVKVAALSVWSLPYADHTIPDDETVAGISDCAPGRIVRGYHVDNSAPSIGDLLLALHEADHTVDGTETVARRVVLASGHPCTITTTETSLVNIRAGQAASFKFRTSNLRGLSSVEVCPVIVWAVAGSGVGNAASVKFTVASSGDSCTISTTAGTFGATLAKGSSTMTSSTEFDTVTIEFLAPSSGAVYLATYTLWEESPW